MLLRRQHITLFLQSLLILLACVSCTSDDVADSNVSKPTDTSGTPGYLTFQVLFDKEQSTRRAPDDESKSGEFIQDNEHGLGGGSKLLLYDGNDKFLEMLDLPLTDTEEKDDYIEVRYTTQLTQLDNDSIQWPSGCLLVLNPSAQAQAELDKLKEGDAMSQALNIVCEESDPRNIGYSNANRQYYTMTNTIYVDGKDDLVTAAKIDPSKISKNPNDSNNIMTIRVERMVAKCSFQIKRDGVVENDLIFTPEAGTASPLIFFKGFTPDGTMDLVAVKDWRVKVTGWGINALETQNYLFKKIDKDATYFDGWNDSDHFRTYWGEDPHYDGQYPWQYRKAVDYPTTPYYQEQGDNNLLRNYSYNQLDFDKQDFDYNQIFYVPENTYDKQSIAGKHDSRDELLAGTHLLVGAELQVKDAEDEGWNLFDTYRDRSGLYYESEKYCFVSLVHSFNQTLTSQNLMEYTLYDWINGGKITSKNVNGKIIPLTDKDTLVANTTGKYMLCYKNEVLDEKKLTDILENYDSLRFANEFGVLAPAIIRDGDGKRLPWIANSIDNGDLTIKKVEENSEGKLVPVPGSLSIHRKKINEYGATVVGDLLWDDVDENDIKSLLYEWVGAVDHFNNGKMYYAKGINNPFNTDDNEKKYGVVRNNWYQFNLTDITSIGTPVDDPTQPIVPDDVFNHDQINVAIYILGWHHISTSTTWF